MEYDAERNAFFAKKGILVLRYSNLDVNRNFEGVCADIALHIAHRVENR